MPNTYFTADTHFYHEAMIRYCNRPFSTVFEMNETLIANWNKVVDDTDKIYILGDFALKCSISSCKDILYNLKGKKYFVLGDHDKQIWKCKEYFEEISPLMKITVDNIPITLCHYALRTWWKSHYNAWSCYAHSHSCLEPIGKSWDVGVDNNKFTPISFEQLREIMKTRPDNFNLIKKTKNLQGISRNEKN